MAARRTVRRDGSHGSSRWAWRPVRLSKRRLPRLPWRQNTHRQLRASPLYSGLHGDHRRHDAANVLWPPRTCSTECPLERDVKKMALQSLTVAAETLDEGYFQTSEESEAFRMEFEMRRIKQDEGLDLISEGLDTLKNLAEDIGEELDRQVPIMDEIDRKVDKANTELRKTNVRLKEIVNQIRSTRNFTVDIILICIILGIGAYLYNVLA